MMKNTGEQFIPGLSSERLKEEHFARYDFVLDFCEGKRVLDIACGSGYGSFHISKVAKKVVGVDVSEQAINDAKGRYSNSNLEFICEDCTKYLANHDFDVIVSFETIEHLKDMERNNFYNKIKKNLCKDGMFIISTPNKVVTSPYTEKPLNEYHVLEFSYKKLFSELEKNFSMSECYGQRFIFTFLTWKVIRKMIRVFEVLLGKDFKIYSELTTAKVNKWNSGLIFQPRIMIFIVANRKNFN